MTSSERFDNKILVSPLPLWTHL